MIVVAILAILSVVAVPAFIKYMRKAKTSEAVTEVEKIYEGAAVWYTTPRVNDVGEKQDCAFPATEAVTPTEGTCCGDNGGPDTNNDDRCDANPEAWNTPTWNDLGFQFEEEHYFVYSFESSGVLSEAKFTARANADLDCDGDMSTFERFGNGDPSATKGECAVVGAAAPRWVDQTE